MLGYCVKGDEVQKSLQEQGVMIVTEYGLKIEKVWGAMVHSSWSQRIQVGYRMYQTIIRP